MADEEIVIKYRAEVDEVKRQINALIDQQEELGNAVKKNSDALAKGSKKSLAPLKEQLGIIGKLEKQIVSLTAARRKSNNPAAIKRYNKNIEATRASIRKLTTETKKSTKKAKGAFDGLSKSVANVGIGIAAAFSVGAITNFLTQATKLTAEFDALRLSFQFIEGGVEEGAETFNFLIEISERLGLELQSTSEAFKLFAGSARISGITAAETKRIFESVSFAVTALGLSSQKAESVFRALSQIISKGTVSSEELRQQMAEVLPGSFKIAADSMGLTEQAFNKLLATGTLLATDFLPKFSEQLRTVFQEGAVLGAQSLNAELNRMQNEITALTLSIGEELAPAWIQFQLQGLKAIESVGDSLRVLGEITSLFFSSDGKGEINTVRIKTEAELTAESIKFVSEVIEKAEKDNIAKEEKRLAIRLNQIKGFHDAGLISNQQYGDDVDEVNDQIAAKEAIRSEARHVAINAEALSLQKQLKKIEDNPLSIGDDGIEIFSEGQERRIDDITVKLKTLDGFLETLFKIDPRDEDNITAGARALLDIDILRQTEIKKLLDLKELEAKFDDAVAAKNLKLIQQAIREREKALKFIRDQKKLDFEATQAEIENDRKVTAALFIELEKRRKAQDDLNRQVSDIRGNAIIDSEAQGSLRERINFFNGLLAVEKDFLDEQTAEVDASFLAAEIDADEAEVAKFKLTEKFGEKRTALLQQLFLTEADLVKGSVAIWIQANDEILQATSDIVSQLATLYSTLTNSRLEDLDRESEALQENLDKQKDALQDSRDNRLITEARFQSSLKNINDQEEANDKRIADEKRKLARKQAIFEKAAAIFSIGINTARGIIAALASAPPNVPLSILIGALGLLQTATVAATPIPQFAKGTKDKKDSGMAIVGEKGPEQMFIPAHAKILPAKQTKTYGNVLDAMYDNSFDAYINKEFIAPALYEQKKRYESSQNENFANNIVTSMQYNGLTYYDALSVQKKGMNMNNVKEFAKAVAVASAVNTRRL